MKTKDWLAFIALSFSWGSSFLWIKIALQEVGPFTLVALRLLIGIIGLLAVIAYTRPEWRPNKRTWQVMAVMGIFNVAAPFTLISWGELHIDSAVASTLNSCVPLFTALVAHFYLKDDRLTPMRGFAILIGFGGVIALLARDLSGDLRASLIGQGAVLVAALMYAGSAVYGRLNMQKLSPIVQAFVPLIVADTLMWLSAPVVEAPFTLPRLPLTWVAIIWLGLIGSGVAYLLYFYLLHAIGPTRATMVTYTFPFIGVLLGWVFLNERVDWSLALGGALIFASLILVNRKPKDKTQSA